jgi:3-deoxy-manno-octulosonate cytidylyltransferase (CMP-KDO synthetase)
MKKNKVVGIIPARYASQRLPGKPLVDLLGKPMIQRVFEQASKARLVDEVVVATDDTRIEMVVKSFGGTAILTSAEIRSGSDRVAAVAQKMKGDIFVNIQGDEPLIVPEMIDEAVQVLLDDHDAPVGTLAKKIESMDELLNPSVVKVALAENRYALYFSRSVIPFLRDVPKQREWLRHGTFYKHIGLYVFRADFLKIYAGLLESRLELAEKLEQLRILENGYRIKAGVTRFDSVPVDTKEDAARVVKILKTSPS